MSSTITSMAKSTAFSQTKKDSGYPNMTHPLISFDFLERAAGRKDHLAPIGCLPLPVQESIMVRELLSVLQGTTRDYICATPLETPMGDQKFLVDDSLHASLKQYVDEMLPIAALYSKFARFVDKGASYECGMVVQAFAAACRQFIREYQIFMTDHEDAFSDGQLTIQRLSNHMMSLVLPFQSLAKCIDLQTEKGIRGGALLSSLYERLRCFPSSKAADQLLLEVIKSTAKPYLNMLTRWMHEGNFDDPYREFMIHQRRSPKKIHDATFWEHRFRLMTEMIPEFLRGYGDKVLMSGKCINIIQECGHSVCDKPIPVMEFSMDVRYYETVINKAYLDASGRLLHLMIEEEKLVQKLLTFKHFFLLDQDDFLADFLAFSFDDLSVSVGRIDKTKFFAVFDDAIKSSVLHVDPHKPMMKPTLKGPDILASVHKVQNLSDSAILATTCSSGPSSSSTSDHRKDAIVFHVFTMDCDIKFPFCLIVNDETKIYYQTLFQNLFRLKVVEWNLNRLWSCCVSSDKRDNRDNRVFTVCCSAFVNQMLNFVKSLQHYFSGEVIEPYWHQMMVKIRAAQTFDEVLQEHTAFIAMCSKECLLTCPDILRLLYKLLDTCSTHCADLLDLQYMDNMNTVKESVDVMREKFAERMTDFLVMMSDSRQNRESEYKLIGAIHRIDFSDFYRQQVSEKTQAQTSHRVFRLFPADSSSAAKT